MDQRAVRSGHFSFRDEHPNLGDGRTEILASLREHPKRLDPKWFYDERGSVLFDRITRLPEYYPTRTEMGILRENSGAIAQCCGVNSLLIEPGSGSSDKARLLLDDLRPAAYVPIDISADFLYESAQRLAKDYPWLDLYAICADFNAGWSFLDDLPPQRRVVFYPGSTIGNLEPAEAERFLERVAAVVGADGGLLIGVDTHKDAGTLNAAYNDSAGVTAEFNTNMLRRLNHLLDAEFREEAFEHRAFYNTDLRRIEMHLVSRETQRVNCGGEVLEFAAGETIHTENSYKYAPQDFAQLAERAGMTIERSWLDDDDLFGVHYLRRVA
jgi:dimethylhistidine N-methyltransferase